MEAAADYYATLRVEPGAEAAAIRLAYRDLMRRYHPDVNASDEAAAKAKAINEAYACLRDPVERAAYDRRRNPRPMGSAFGAPPPPRHAPRPGWRPQHAYIVDEEQEPQPRKWKVASLGLAALLTVITFTITSAIPPVIMPPPEPTVVVQTELPEAQPDPGCLEAGGDARLDCGDEGRLAAQPSEVPPAGR